LTYCTGALKGRRYKIKPKLRLMRVARLIGCAKKLPVRHCGPRPSVAALDRKNAGKMPALPDRHPVTIRLMAVLATGCRLGSHLSDANVTKMPSLIGDWFLNFDGAWCDGNYFSFVLKRL
jgi:hypothetical protein